MNCTDCAIIKGKREMKKLQVDVSTLLHPPPFRSPLGILTNSKLQLGYVFSKKLLTGIPVFSSYI